MRKAELPEEASTSKPGRSRHHAFATEFGAQICLYVSVGLALAVSANRQAHHWQAQGPEALEGRDAAVPLRQSLRQLNTDS